MQCKSTSIKESISAVSKDKPKNVLMCNYCANKKGAHRFSDKRLRPAWGVVYRKCKSKITFQTQRSVNDYKNEDKRNIRSKTIKIIYQIKQFVLRVEEDGEDYYYGVLDKVCELNQNCDRKTAFANFLLSKKIISVRYQIKSGSTSSVLPVKKT